MAFQVGTRVDPRLLDYSGYAQGMTQAAAIKAQSLMDLGQKVGDTITKYQEKKEDKRKREGFRPVVDDFVSFTNPDMPEDEREVIAKAIIENGTLSDLQDLSTTYQMERMKFDYLQDLNERKLDIEERKAIIAGQPKQFTGQDVIDAKLAIEKNPSYKLKDGYVYKKLPNGELVPAGLDDPFIGGLKGGSAFLFPDQMGLGLSNEGGYDPGLVLDLTEGERNASMNTLTGTLNTDQQNTINNLDDALGLFDESGNITINPSLNNISSAL